MYTSLQNSTSGFTLKRGKAHDNLRMTSLSAYEQLGGADAVQRLVKRFYALMNELPEAEHIRQMHPHDMARSEDSLFKFLSGWFGGPPLFVQERGHPRLRMRHAAFNITPQARDEWMLCMRQALSEQVSDAHLRLALEQAFAGMADHLINT
jgi:hemoglobin